MIKRFLLLVLFSLVSCKQEILHNLKEEQASILIARLNQVKITGSKDKQPDGRYSVSVDSSDTTKALDYLHRSRLLNSEAKIVKEESALIPTAEDSKLRYERLKANELSASIRDLKGVLDVKVHLNLPTLDTLLPVEKNGGSGSVLLIVVPEFNLSKESIAALVAGGSGLSPENVSVLINVEAESEVLPDVKPVESELSLKLNQISPKVSPKEIFPLFSLMLVAMTLLGGLGWWLLFGKKKERLSLSLNPDNH
jgi:type III secretory pathway lipoprotein EscJ